MFSGGLDRLVTMKPTRGQSSPRCHSTFANKEGFAYVTVHIPGITR